MKLSEYKKNLKHTLLPRTVTFLLQNNSVILGLKKRGFGKNYYLGIGGKVEKNERIEEGARREIKEEINVEVNQLIKVGVVHFYFPHIEDESWNQDVHIFISHNWQGQPKETDEIKPFFFTRAELPYAKMWHDAQYWIPPVLDGKQVDGEFMFDENLHVIEKHLKTY
jgi:8-oxo-dGTP pyrophosphatase MutT (NUDIX family)